MRRALLLIPLLAACHSAASRPVSGPTPTAANPSTAVSDFLGGVSKHDAALIGDVWGTSDWLVRDHYSKTEFGQRAVIMMCYLSHQSFRILGESPSLVDHGVSVAVELSGKERVSTVTFLAVRRPSADWIVQDVDIAHLSPGCSGNG